MDEKNFHVARRLKNQAGRTVAGLWSAPRRGTTFTSRRTSGATAALHRFGVIGAAWNPSITEFLPHRYDSLPAPFLGFRHDRRESHETRDGLHDGLPDRLAAAA